MARFDHSGQKTIREIGGEVWAELLKVPESDIRWDVRNAVVDTVMGVLARHAGKALINDPDLPVEPLPTTRRKGTDTG